MNEFLTNLKRQASENPMAALAGGAVFLQAAAKIGTAYAANKNSKAWKKEVNRRVEKTKSKK